MTHNLYPAKLVNGKLLRYDPDFVGDEKRFTRQMVTIECVECEVRTASPRGSQHQTRILSERRCGVPVRVFNGDMGSADWQVTVFGPELVTFLKERVRNRPYQLRDRNAPHWGVSYADIFQYDKSLLNRKDLSSPEQLTLQKGT